MGNDDIKVICVFGSHENISSTDDLTNFIAREDVEYIDFVTAAKALLPQLKEEVREAGRGREGGGGREEDKIFSED